MAVSHGKNLSDEDIKPARKFVFRLRFSSILTVLVLAIAAMSVAYIGGVMAGRQSVASQKTLLATMGEDTATESSRPQATEEDVSTSKILTPEELKFAQELKGIPPKASDKPLTVPPEKPAADLPAQAGPYLPAAQNENPENIAPAASTSEDQQTLYDYVFQVAALKDEISADKLRQQLEGHGLRTRLERKGNIYFVLVHMRGTPQRVAELDEIARTLRLGQPLQRSKKMVSR